MYNVSGATMYTHRGRDPDGVLTLQPPAPNCLVFYSFFFFFFYKNHYYYYFYWFWLSCLHGQLTAGGLVSNPLATGEQSLLICFLLERMNKWMDGQMDNPSSWPGASQTGPQRVSDLKCYPTTAFEGPTKHLKQMCGVKRRECHCSRAGRGSRSAMLSHKAFSG